MVQFFLLGVISLMVVCALVYHMLFEGRPGRRWGQMDPPDVTKQSIFGYEGPPTSPLTLNGELADPPRGDWQARHLSPDHKI